MGEVAVGLHADGNDPVEREKNYREQSLEGQVTGELGQNLVHT